MNHYTSAMSLFTIITSSVICSAHTSDTSVSSPSGHIEVEFSLSQTGAPLYEVLHNETLVIESSRLGLVRDDTDFSQHLRLTNSSTVTPISDDYEILTAKRRHNHYRANQKTFQLTNKDGKPIEIIFQVSNDGVAFRYHFPETSAHPHTILKEVTSFNFQASTQAWLQPMSVAKTGWARTNPSYEELYEDGIAVGTDSKLGVGWAFPALFNTGTNWCIVSESALDRHYAAARLSHKSPNGEYTIAFPTPLETHGQANVNPCSTLPWTTPWRFITIGSLKTVTESTLGIDLATPATTDSTATTIQPGKASWSWPLNGDDQTVYDVQIKYIDYAADMGWEYCLIDSLWDTQIGTERIQSLVDYAAEKEVGILLWYNSNGNWNDSHQTPKHQMLTHDSRIAEFARLQKMGVKGMKIDFFAGDGQPVINYYIDILEDAAPYGLLINFHGCTLPRGWQRTYPHLMTVEAIRGFEFMTFFQDTANAEPRHATTIPFTRNVFDPMDFTPLAPGTIQIGPKSKRITTSAFELALTVVFTSGIQHYPETPEGMAKIPEFAKTFLKQVPSIWEDSQFIDGYPGKLVVIARKGDGRWYVAGINGENTVKELSLDLSELGITGSGTLITDGINGLIEKTVPLGEHPVKITLQPNGGFVLSL